EPTARAVVPSDAENSWSGTPLTVAPVPSTAVGPASPAPSTGEVAVRWRSVALTNPGAVPVRTEVSAPAMVTLLEIQSLLPTRIPAVVASVARPVPLTVAWTMLFTRWIWLPAAGEMAWNSRLDGWARMKVLEIAYRLPFRAESAALSVPQR